MNDRALYGLAVILVSVPVFVVQVLTEIVTR